jgi:penicillin-binding protein 1C
LVFLNFKIKYFLIIAIASIFLILFAFCLPNQLFKSPTSTVITDVHGQLLGGTIAGDGQWRFASSGKVPEKFKEAILTFEDQHFYQHFGVNPVSMARALWLNTKNRRIVAGGSTLTMQTIRLSRQNQSRTILEKLIEVILATRAEIRYSKNEILELYAANAPFGGNTVGLDAACWRYFGRPSSELSWAEAAMLAVLPNSPSLIRLEKNRNRLLSKRNALLLKLYKKEIFDKNTYLLAVSEPLTDQPPKLPIIAPHLLTRIDKTTQKGKYIKTSIDKSMQLLANEIIEKHISKYRFNEIFNAAVLIAECETGNVLAYVGNTQSHDSTEHGCNVDIVTAKRSTGSILKPILYAAMLDEGEILPGTLLPDIPILFTGYAPKNFSNTYDGAVHAQRALSRSLNVPSVFMLRDYGVDRFYDLLKRTGIQTLNYPAAHYGLSLILGGAEASLWDIAGVYASMSRTLLHFANNSGKYNGNDFHPLSYIPDSSQQSKASSEKGKLNASSIWLTYKALREVNRPEDETGWEWFASNRTVAWKTGTSFGFRDAWAVGTDSKYVVAVWVGNANNEGRPELIGNKAAAPILFDIFSRLPKNNWFQQPYDEMQQINVCRVSGHRANEFCTETDTLWVQLAGLKTAPCPYHKQIFVDKTKKFRVGSNCMSISKMVPQTWFILPPSQEWFYRQHNPDYKAQPPYLSNCVPDKDYKVMEFIYPRSNAKIFIPIDLDSKKSRTIFEVAHRHPEKKLYWHIDENYIGTSQKTHQMPIITSKGEHTVSIIDEDGNVLSRQFEVIDK